VTNTPDEQHNVDPVLEYMEIAKAAGHASAQVVSHLCSPNDRFNTINDVPGRPQT